MTVHVYSARLKIIPQYFSIADIRDRIFFLLLWSHFYSDLPFIFIIERKKKYQIHVRHVLKKEIHVVQCSSSSMIKWTNDMPAPALLHGHHSFFLKNFTRTLSDTSLTGIRWLQAKAFNHCLDCLLSRERGYRFRIYEGRDERRGMVKLIKYEKKWGGYFATPYLPWDKMHSGSVSFFFFNFVLVQVCPIKHTSSSGGPINRLPNLERTFTEIKMMKRLIDSFRRSVRYNLIKKFARFNYAGWPPLSPETLFRFIPPHAACKFIVLKSMCIIIFPSGWVPGLFPELARWWVPRKPVPRYLLGTRYAHFTNSFPHV